MHLHVNARLLMHCVHARVVPCVCMYVCVHVHVAHAFVHM